MAHAPCTDVQASDAVCTALAAAAAAAVALPSSVATIMFLFESSKVEHAQTHNTHTCARANESNAAAHE